MPPLVLQRRAARHTALVTALVTIVFAQAAEAQLVSRPGLTLAGARQVIDAAISLARKNNAPGAVVAVVDEGGNLMAVERLDGTFAAGANISIGKARTAALFRKPTKFFEDVVNKGRTAMTALVDFTPLQGGVPIVSGETIVGAVGVSGASSAQQDEEIAMAGAAAIGGTNGTEPVRFFDRASVDAAFAKGSVLLDGDGRNYMVHASRRDKAGMVEVHDLDTDIIYVQGGSATFVTGGTAQGLSRTEPFEQRGNSIDGGQTRQLARGDVVIVPSGVPHWFREVPSALVYYVVKVRR
ncbi:MAG TPA: heme-binding protein [Candidatus Binatia bacterium]|jgi:glc operon protein GlcG